MEGQGAEKVAPGAPVDDHIVAAVDPLTKAEPKILKPTCAACGADPLIIKRLRYDFPDGVVVEVLFCRNEECRAAIGAQIVGIEPVRPKK